MYYDNESSIKTCFNSPENWLWWTALECLLLSVIIDDIDNL